MSASAEPMDQLEGLLANLDQGGGAEALPWLEELRADAGAQVRTLGWPQRKSEQWRYARPDQVLEWSLAPRATAAGTAPEVPGLAREAGGPRLVFVDGRLSAELSEIGELPQGLELASLADKLSRSPKDVEAWLGKIQASSGHVFNALNTAVVADGAWIHCAAGVEVNAPVDIVHVFSEAGQGNVAQSRHLLVLEKDARLHVNERFVTLGESVPYFNNGVSEIALAEGAQLLHYRLQEEAMQAIHMHGLFVAQEAHSRYQCVNLSLGGGWARTDIQVDFRGEHAHAQLDGLYMAGDGQTSDVHLNVLHNVPNCSSEENFRGILHGNGRGVFDGRILVDKDAQKTDAQLANDNLLLSRKAEIDTKPQLEIYADDVKCSHGTTVGQLDQNHLFYLRSRGIEKGEARKMLCVGFAGEILVKIEADESLRARAEAIIGAALEHVAEEAET